MAAQLKRILIFSVKSCFEQVTHLFSKYIRDFFTELSRSLNPACSHSANFSCDTHLGQKSDHCLYLRYWLQLPLTAFFSSS